MFSGSSSLTSLEGLQNWDVSSVTNMRAMFSNCSGLTTASAINDWNVNGVAYTSNTSSNNNFYRMFYNANNSHPTFSRRDGYWDADGSFIPST